LKRIPRQLCEAGDDFVKAVEASGVERAHVLRVDVAGATHVLIE
jgi:hypothetical protein